MTTIKWTKIQAGMYTHIPTGVTIEQHAERKDWQARMANGTTIADSYELLRDCKNHVAGRVARLMES